MVFDLRLGRGRDGPKQFLGSSAGMLQSDGYAAYEGVGGPALVHAACWTILFEAGQLNPDDAVATAIVARINDLFAIDGEAREQKLDAVARQALRQKRARSLLEEIKSRIEAARANALPAGALAKACQYTLALWPKLIRPGVSRTGAEQQPGGELDASGGGRTQELDSRGQPSSGSQDRRHPFHRRNLPPPAASRARPFG